MTWINCVTSANQLTDSPGRWLHHQVRHPRRRRLAHQRPLVVQDEHLILADLRHKVEVLLQRRTSTHTFERSHTHTHKWVKLRGFDADLWRSWKLPEPCRCDRNGQLTWLWSRSVLIIRENENCQSNRKKQWNHRKKFYSCEKNFKAQLWQLWSSVQKKINATRRGRNCQVFILWIN